MPLRDIASLPVLDIARPGFDFRSPDVAAIREQSWCARIPLGIAVLRYAQAQEMLRHPKVFPDGRQLLLFHGITSGPVYDWFVPILLHQHGDDHLRQRRLVNKAFSPRMIDGIRPYIRETTDRLAANLAGREVCEFVEEFADQLPVCVMGRILGIPQQDSDAFYRWSNDMGLIYCLIHAPDVYPRVEAAVTEITGYIDSLIAERTSHPADDLISALIRAQQEEGRISPEDLRSLVTAMTFAAHDTVSHQISLAMVAFTEHHDQWMWLRDHPDLADQALTEVMRWNPSVPGTYRSAIEDFDFHGVHIPAGTFIAVCTQLADRDPRVFKDPDDFDITVEREAPHMTFGGGPHYCLGASAGRAELTEALVSLTARLGPPEIAGQPAWRPSMIGIVGPETLPLRFEDRQ
jgi:cytochrome P450